MAKKPAWKITSKSSLENVSKKLAKTEEMTADVGFFENSKYFDGLPVAQVAVWNEYGTTRETPDGEVVNVPARSFMRSTFDESSAQVNREAVKSLQNKDGILEDPQGAIGKILDLWGQKMRDLMKAKIGSNVPPLLTIETVLNKDREGLADPEHTLVWSGTMQTEVDYKVGIGGIDD